MRKPALLFSLFAFAVVAMLVCCASPGTTQTTTPPKPEPTTEAPRLRFNPPVLVTTPDSLGFVTARIYIYNDGGGTLMMSEIKASCGCAGGSVQRNKVTSSDSGMIYLQINSKSFTEDINNVDFTVKSNADNSPTVFRAIIHRR